MMADEKQIELLKRITTDAPELREVRDFLERLRGERKAMAPLSIAELKKIRDEFGDFRCDVYTALRRDPFGIVEDAVKGAEIGYDATNELIKGMEGQNAC